MILRWKSKLLGILKDNILIKIFLRNKFISIIVLSTIVATVFHFYIFVAPAVIFLTQYYIIQRNSVYDRLKIWEERLSYAIPEITEQITKNKTEADLNTNLKIYRAKISIGAIKANNPLILYSHIKELSDIEKYLQEIYVIGSGEFNKGYEDEAVKYINSKYTLIIKEISKIL